MTPPGTRRPRRSVQRMVTEFARRHGAPEGAPALITATRAVAVATGAGAPAFHQDLAAAIAAFDALPADLRELDRFIDVLCLIVYDA
jgi:hypothetical protein